MSTLGKIYLGALLLLITLLGLWAGMTLPENRAPVTLVAWLPRLELEEPFLRIQYRVNLAWLIGGLVLALGLLILWAIRLPFRVRNLAVLRRRVRELEQEVLHLRTLPLREQDDDDYLAQTARVDDPEFKIMTEKLALDRRHRDGHDEIAAEAI